MHLSARRERCGGFDHGVGGGVGVWSQKVLRGWIECFRSNGFVLGRNI